MHEGVQMPGEGSVVFSATSNPLLRNKICFNKSSASFNKSLVELESDFFE